MRVKSKIQNKEMYDFKKMRISERKFQMLLQFIEYFDAKHIFVNDKNIREALQFTGKNISVETKISSDFDKQKYDLIFINKEAENLDITSFLERMHNDSVLIINGINKNCNKIHWQKLINYSKTTACINTFTQGYVFIRREQKKEVFYIKV
ncbi:hypothetical protein CAPN001_07860 [Capnocytophaga stomatis]|nr:hypothetical protein CAPN002_02930 [Capnocytophaga stomatis]GIJ96217.1 hypothetical protein CAPN001_07860 [Capnocytophaga stomatis]GIM49235.1 hypothetical protein CAPN003_06870 [Capnocytophaga stomatis]